MDYLSKEYNTRKESHREISVKTMSKTDQAPSEKSDDVYRMKAL